MMENNIDDFEKIIELSKIEIGTASYKLNFNLNVKFNLGLIKASLGDVHEIAKNFQAPECPDNLYMNHGQFIHVKGDGIKNVIKELRDKANSNRAIISLINQCEIVDSGDNPIPSFMVLQFSIEGSTLYTTVYFRALEVSKFLKINIEEIRLIISQINNSFIDRIKDVSLSIFAFRAYINTQINVLERAKIDRIPQKDLLKYLLVSSNLEDLISLLQQRKQSPTVIEYQSFEYILSILVDKDYSSMIHPDLCKPLTIKYFKEIIELCKELKKLRQFSSHSSQVTEIDEKYQNKIEMIIKELRNDA